MKFATSTVQTHFESPLGRLILAATNDHLVGVWFDGQRHQPDASAWPETTDHPVLQQARTQLTDYFAGQRTTFDVPLDLSIGTPFQQAVWHALLKIPSGAQPFEHHRALSPRDRGQRHADRLRGRT